MFTLPKEAGQRFLRQRMGGVVLAPLLIGSIQIPGTDGGIRFEAEVTFGVHKLQNVITFVHCVLHIALRPLADGEVKIVFHKPAQAFYGPKKNTLFFPAQFFSDERVISAIGVSLLCFQDQLSAEESVTPVMECLQSAVAKGQKADPEISLVALLEGYYSAGYSY